MTRIYKYPIELIEVQDVELPAGAEILHVAFQQLSQQFCLWAIVDPETTQIVSRTIKIYGTGHPLKIDTPDQTLNYLGSIQDEPFVWHIFEQVKR